MGSPDLSIFNRFSKDQLTYHFHSMEGKKDLIIEEELMKPLDQISGGVSYLRQQGVEKIFKLHDHWENGGECQKIIILRPYPESVKLVVNGVKNDKKKNISHKYYLVFTPKKLNVCDKILEEEGVFGDVIINEYSLDFITLDADVMSLELPVFYTHLFLNKDTTWLYIMARALQNIEGLLGKIPKGVCIGKRSKLLYDLLQTLSSNEQSHNHPTEIGSFIIVDRDIDYVSMMCSQLTYEGLVAETFGIKTGIVEFGKEVTGSDKKLSVALKSSDQVFDEIRGMHITNVFTLLSHRAKHLQSRFEKRNELDTVKEFRQFVSEDLGMLKQQQKSLAMHIGACEKIMQAKQEDYFEDCLHVEQCVLDDLESKECINFIENCINKQSEQHHCLRLLCLLSLCKGGIDTILYKSLKRQYLQSFGYKHIVTMKNLEVLGLYTQNTDKRNMYPKLKRKFNLIPKDPVAVSKSSAKDLSYVFGGAYTPFIPKLVELIIQNGFSQQLEESLRAFQINTFEHKQDNSAKDASGVNKVSLNVLKTVLVVFMGDCTHTEVNALRFIGKQLGYKLIILTGSIVTSKDFLNKLIVP
ncbi:vacuolar protein sorting-associated protein 33B isoform X4 [Hydra vulgaris]|uniref:Vacuolar protein sorting-associated protein 33B isoform X4 n=1 Tax=Hydra vulgaris TaxID=6087 RepID=A0ABM4DEA9_HYDVU